MSAPARRAPDGSPYPERGSPRFEREVRAMFAHIAARYDTFDHLASLGQDLLWRPRALWSLDRFRGGRPVRRFLDIGCGPGSLTLLAARHFRGAAAVGADFTPEMLGLARRDPRRRGTQAPEYVRANALGLPFPSGAFDLVLSAFVVRNLLDLDRAHAEFLRVLRPGGTVLTLEISEPTHPRVAQLFHSYFDHVVPWLGAAFESAGPYRYLPGSLRTLPGRSGMLDSLRRAGFVRAEAHPQSFGIVTTYLGEAPTKS